MGVAACCALLCVDPVVDLCVGGKQPLCGPVSDKNHKLVSHQMFAYLVMVVWLLYCLFYTILGET